MIAKLSDGSFRITEKRGDSIEPIVVDFEESLSGWSFEMQLKKDKKNSTSVLTLAVGTGLSVSGTQLTISPTATQLDIPGGTYFFDLKTTDSANKVDRKKFYGIFIIEDNVTR